MVIPLPPPPLWRTLVDRRIDTSLAACGGGRPSTVYSRPARDGRYTRGASRPMANVRTIPLRFEYILGSSGICCRAL